MLTHSVVANSVFLSLFRSLCVKLWGPIVIRDVFIVAELTYLFFLCPRQGCTPASARS